MLSSIKSKYLISFLILIASSVYISCGGTKKDIYLDASYPRWLKSDNVIPAQTSGITFIGSRGSEDEYLICDDIGKIHRLFIVNDTVFRLETIAFSPETDSFLAKLPKKDFEEIFYDKYSGRIYLSIEGNGIYVRRDCGIYEIKFTGDDIHGNEISEIKPTSINKEESLFRYTKSNIGFEGGAVDEYYIYLGIESISEDLLTSLESEIYIIDKKTSGLLKTINTREYGIRTISGLFRQEDLLWGIDRNDRKIFFLRLDTELNITEVKKFPLDNVIPGYRKFKYVAAIESVTINDKGGMFLVDDPWTVNYVPDDKVLGELDTETAGNFRKFVPVIYRYNIK